MTTSGHALPSRRAATLGPALLVLVLLLALAALPQRAHGAEAPAPTAGSDAWVAVSVATLWVRPGEARAVDLPALATPADPAAWVAAMTVAQKRWLVGRLETQALYGTRVRVLRVEGAWAKVAVHGQPTPRDARGYPGWLPTAQLTTAAPAASTHIAIVKRPRAWLWVDEALTVREMQASYGTRLSVSSWTAERVEVVALDGRRLHLKRSTVAIRQRGEPWPRLTGSALVREAKLFLGLQYLWAGTSGFGYDCSGFTHSVYRRLGVTIPRDAGPQARQGRKVASRAALRAGDLVFFRSSSGGIGHVGMYAGGGAMIHAPRTGAPVASVSIWSEPYRSSYAGARRFTP